MSKPMVRAELKVYRKFAPKIAREKRNSHRVDLILRCCGGLVGTAADRSAAAEFVLKGITACLER